LEQRRARVPCCRSEVAPGRIYILCDDVVRSIQAIVIGIYLRAQISIIEAVCRKLPPASRAFRFPTWFSFLRLGDRLSCGHRTKYLTAGLHRLSCSVQPPAWYSTGERLDHTYFFLGLSHTYWRKLSDFERDAMICLLVQMTRTESNRPRISHIYFCPMSYCRLGLRVDGTLPSHYRRSKRLARSLEVILAKMVRRKGAFGSEAAEQSCRKPQSHSPSSAVEATSWRVEAARDGISRRLEFPLGLYIEDENMAGQQRQRIAGDYCLLGAYEWMEIMRSNAPLRRSSFRSSRGKKVAVFACS